LQVQPHNEPPLSPKEKVEGFVESQVKDGVLAAHEIDLAQQVSLPVGVMNPRVRSVVGIPPHT
jgi:hypothetical protein